MKTLRVWLTGFCVLAYAFMWYNDTMVPAWHTLIWVVLAFVNDIDEYLQEKINILKKSLP